MPVLGVEAFGKAVPANARFIDGGWRNNGNERDADQLDAGRCKRVVVGKRAATHKSQRKALFTVAEEIPPTQRIGLVELMIDFDNPAVDIIGKRSRENRIERLLRLSDRRCNARVVLRSDAGTSAVRSWPAFARGQKTRNDRVNATRGGVIGDVGRGWDAGRCGLRAHLADPLVVNEEEGLVLDDGAAEGPAKLIVVEWILRQRGVVEEVPGVQRIVAEKFGYGAVILIGAALGYDIHHGAGAAPVLGFEVGGHV